MQATYFHLLFSQATVLKFVLANPSINANLLSPLGCCLQDFLSIMLILNVLTLLSLLATLAFLSLNSHYCLFLFCHHFAIFI